MASCYEIREIYGLRHGNDCPPCCEFRQYPARPRRCDHVTVDWHKVKPNPALGSVRVKPAKDTRKPGLDAIENCRGEEE